MNRGWWRLAGVAFGVAMALITYGFVGLVGFIVWKAFFR